MSKTIKVGGVDVQIPDDSPLASGPVIESGESFTAEKPEEPEKFEQLQHVYRPNDPFQSNIDRVVVLGNVHSSGKRWVKATFMICFVILPFSCMELLAINELVSAPEGSRVSGFILLNVIGLIISSPYLAIWMANRKKNYRNNTNTPA